MSILQKCVNDYLKQAESEDVLRFASDFFDSPQAMTLFEDFDLSQEEKNLAAAMKKSWMISTPREPVASQSILRYASLHE